MFRDYEIETKKSSTPVETWQIRLSVGVPENPYLFARLVLLKCEHIFPDVSDHDWPLNRSSR